jgi:hypothetical protein
MAKARAIRADETSVPRDAEEEDAPVAKGARSASPRDWDAAVRRDIEEEAARGVSAREAERVAEQQRWRAKRVGRHGGKTRSG